MVGLGQTFCVKLRRVIVVLLACVVVAGVVAFVRPGEREPVYQGKKLGFWLLACNPRTPGLLIYDSQVARAVREAGTNALPFLLEWVRYERPAWKDRLLTRFDKLLGKLAAPLSEPGSVRIGSNSGPMLSRAASTSSAPGQPRRSLPWSRSGIAAVRRRLSGGRGVV